MGIKITLKAARTNKKLTQAEAGKKFGVSKDTVANWENGKSFPDALQIKEIEKVYGIAYDSLNFLP